MSEQVTTQDGNVQTGIEFAGLSVAIGSGVGAIVSGTQVSIRVPYDCQIVGVEMLADVAGAVVVDIWKDTYTNAPPADADSITASAPPTIPATNQKSQDLTLTGWTTAIAAGDWLTFNVDSCTTIARVTVALILQRT